MSHESCSWQLNLKFGMHLLNLYANDAKEFGTMLDELTELAPKIQSASKTFEPQASFGIGDVRAAPPPVVTQAAPAAAPVQGSVPVADEIGPLPVQKVEEQAGVGKNGKPYTRYKITIGNVTASTFDTLLGTAAKNLMGKPAYFSAVKGNYGYDLKSLRSA